MSKLTLHVPEELVSVAKDEAAARRVSVSKLVSDFFSTLSKRNAAVDLEIDRLAPRTKRLAGCITATDADMQDYINYLDRKHS
ncbi:MAG: DUF6364 family protein [Chthoniobacterales bacterium]